MELILCIKNMIRGVMMKKIISIILTVVSILSLCITANAAELTEQQRAELYDLGIIVGDGDGDLRLYDAVTRAEAVKLLCVAGNLTSQHTADCFDDVPETHWAYPYICAAKEAGLASGDETGSFHPDSNITNEEMVKMIVCLLGYGPQAEVMSGYPAGYTAVAARIGVTKGLTLDVNTPALRNDVAVMLSNALNIPLMEKVEEGVYRIMDGTYGIPLQTLKNK